MLLTHLVFKATREDLLWKCLEQLKKLMKKEILRR